MTQDTNDKKDSARESYYKLGYYFENKVKVFFKQWNGRWFNAYILDLNWNKMIVILNEDVLPSGYPVFLEKINPETITPSFREDKK